MVDKSYIHSWLSLEVASDMTIAGALVYFLLKFMTNAFKETRSRLYKLILVAIESGSVTSLLAIILLVTCLTDLESNVTVGVGYK